VADTCAQCGGQLAASPSPDFCSDSCQSAWHSKSAIHAITRPSARRVSSDRAPHVPAATWPKPPEPIPHRAGGITYPVSETDHRRWIEDTDPAPAEPPAIPGGLSADEAARNLSQGIQSLPTANDLLDFIREHQADPAAEQRIRELLADYFSVDVDRVVPGLTPQENGPALPTFRILSAQPERQNIIRRILNATKRK